MKPIRLWSLLTVALAMGGCADNYYNPDNPIPDVGELTLEYRVDGEMPVRSVLAQKHETKIDNVHVMFFDNENGNFISHIRVPVTDGKNTFAFDVPENLEIEKEYKVLAIGNADVYSSDLDDTLKKIKDEEGTYNNALISLQAFSDNAIISDNPGRLPMFGHFIDKSEGGETTFTVVEVDEKRKVKESETSEFLFSRAICRFDIHNLVANVLDIRYARVVNTPNTGYYFTDGIDVREKIPEYQPKDAPSGAGYMPITEDVEDGVRMTQRLEASLYGFPNSVNTSIVNDKVTTALMIAGYYIDAETGEKDPELTYYRFNLANLGEAQALNRNFCYRATIKGVRERGASTEQEAYNRSQPIFYYDFNPVWNANDDNVVTDGDGNFLIVNQTHMTFNGDATDADCVELRVSTSPELSWNVSPVDQPGESNGYFLFEKISNQAVKCGPKEINDTPYVRYGYWEITAKNEETGKELHLMVYLQQMSKRYNVKTLTVNGNTGTIVQQLDPMGGTLVFPVVTGSIENTWSVEDVDGVMRRWGNGVNYTREGGNGSQLQVMYPANVTGKDRTATLIVSLDQNEMVTDKNGNTVKKVPDVVIQFTQENSPQLLDVIGMPLDGNLEIECFSTDFDNPNGVVNSKGFVVQLTDNRYRYKVTSSFDKNRDLCLSKDYSRGVLSSDPATASHPADEGGNPIVETNDELTDMVNKSTFYINPFRMGPDDPKIGGTIKVTAYMPDDDTAPTEERIFGVTLKSTGYRLDDVIVDGIESGEVIIVPDRNYGTPSKIMDGVKGEYVADYYSSLPGFTITGLESSNDQSWVGITRDYNAGVSHIKSTSYWTPDINGVLQNFIVDNVLNGYPYTDNDKWTLPTNELWGKVQPRVCFSKGRCFIVSNYKSNENGVARPVVCWLPYKEAKDARLGMICLYYPTSFYYYDNGYRFNITTGARLYTDKFEASYVQGSGAVKTGSTVTQYNLMVRPFYKTSLTDSDFEEYLQAKNLIK